MDYGTKAEMTAALRSGIFRFTYPASDSAFVMVDLQHTLKWDCAWSDIRLEDERTIVGTAARFDKPVKDFRIFQDGKPVIYNTNRFRSSLEAFGTGLRAYVRFATSEGEQVQVKVAVSGVSMQGALLNLEELNGKDFEAVLKEAEAKWEKELGRYQLDTDDKALRQTFYTSVYRTALHPFLFQDADGRLRRPRDSRT